MSVRASKQIGNIQIVRLAKIIKATICARK